MALAPWTGEHVSQILDITTTTDSNRSLFDVTELVGMALRHNPKRAHLLVSRVLGKHVPSQPGLLIAAGELLGVLAGRMLDARTPSAFTIDGLREIAAEISAALKVAPDAAEAEDHAARARQLLEPLKTIRPHLAMLGYAETATGLGKLVSLALGSYYIHSTRHAGADHLAFGAFEEEHSHATSHRILPRSPDLLSGTGPMVLIDDEISTGNTIISTIRDLQASAPRQHYVVAALVDLRTKADRARFDSFAAELGIRVDVVALASGTLSTPVDVLERASAYLELEIPANPIERANGSVEILELSVPKYTQLSDRHGSSTPLTNHLLDSLSAQISQSIRSEKPVLVLGTEEFLYLPLAVADSLNGKSGTGYKTVFSSTTRSPIAVLDLEGYAVTSSVNFSSHDETIDGPGARFAYNVGGSPGGFGTIVVIPEPGTDVDAITGRGSLTKVLAAVCDQVVVALLPPPGIGFPSPLHGPEFGSYAPEEVSWLLKDLSGIALEAPTEDRERAIQRGQAHYAESLPMEYQPSEQYLELYEKALEKSSRRVALAIGIVAELAVSRRHGIPVLASLARAGTPVGVLMKRWFDRFHAANTPHYTMSIVRGRGIDKTAMNYLAAHHDPRDVLFVDGWTGKGAISRELEAAVLAFNQDTGFQFSPELAVLADPGHCSTLFGTRDDFLIPSACLNSTVSGLVSRTVLNDALIGPDDFHGAKFYEELRSSDRSGSFLEEVSVHFDAVFDEAVESSRLLLTNPAQATWSGWSAVEDISHEYGIGNTNFVKPGVGETTRVLLRRVPWKILVRPDAAPDLEHVLLLAAQRGVDVIEVLELPYSCVGLIDPGFAENKGKTS